MRKLAILVGTALAISSSAHAASVPSGKALALPRGGAALSEAQLQSAASAATPMEKRLSAPPAGIFSKALSPTFEMSAPPGMMAGAGPSIPTKVAAPSLPKSGSRGGGEAPENYGFNRYGTVYQFTDSFVLPYTSYPFAASGWFYFTDYANRQFRCTATLISAAIAITAGHCVHDQFVHGGAGWIKSGWFAPAYYNGNFPYGYAYAVWVNTTGGWY